MITIFVFRLDNKFKLIEFCFIIPKSYTPNSCQLFAPNVNKSKFQLNKIWRVNLVLVKDSSHLNFQNCPSFGSNVV